MATQTGSIDLKAAKQAHDDASKTATDYITYIDSANGIRVHNAGDSSNFAQMNSNGMQIYKGGTTSDSKVAEFGERTVIGKEAYGHIEIDNKGLHAWGNSTGSSIGSGTVMSYLNSRSLGLGNNYTESDISMSNAVGRLSASYDNSVGMGVFVSLDAVAPNEAVMSQLQLKARRDDADNEAYIFINEFDNEDIKSSFIELYADEVRVPDIRGFPTSLLSYIWPVGSYYETSDTSFDPNYKWGGTWELETSGQVHVSAGDGYTVAGALSNESDGGNKDAIIPYHNHSVSAVTNGISGGGHTHQPSNTAYSFLALQTNVTGITRHTTASGSGAPNMVRSAGGTIDRLSATNSTTHSHNLPAHNTNYAGTDGNLTNANM